MNRKTLPRVRLPRFRAALSRLPRSELLAIWNCMTQPGVNLSKRHDVADVIASELELTVTREAARCGAPQVEWCRFDARLGADVDRLGVVARSHGGSLHVVDVRAH